MALAQLLSNRHVTLFSGSLHHTAVRRRFLLAALLQVSRALDAVPKAIGATDRFLDLLELLSHFHFPQALQLLQDGRWTARVQSKLRQARLKKCLAQWRLMARSSASAKRILRGDVGRERLLPKAILRPVAALEEGPSLKLFFRKWGLAYRLKRVTACNSVDLAVRVMPKWRKCTLLKQVYEHYMGHGTFTSVTEIAVQPSASFGPRVLAAYAFKSWRGLSKLQRRRIDDFIHDKRSAFDGWRRRTEKRGNHYTIASLYDCTRNLRPALSIWHGLCQKTRQGRDAAIKFNLARLLGKSMEIWREKRTKLTRLNRFLGRWRGALEFKGRCQATAHEYLQRKLIVNKLLQWRQRTVIVTTLQASADKLIKKKFKDQAEIYFNVWHKMKTWINRSSEKMRTIRAARLAKNALNHWRMQLQTKQAAESLYRVGLVKKCWAVWTLKLWEAQEAKSTKSGVLENWRRIVAIRNAVKVYFKHQGVNNPCIEAHPWPDACVRLQAQSIFNVLRRRALLRRQLDFYTHKKNVGLQADIFKGWRLDANVVFYLKQKPWRSKRRILRKLRVLFGHKHEEHSKLHVALDEHLRGKQYVAFYRGFERWQQAFQSRKMEEHLCDQNVQYYYRRKRLLVLHNWQLLTALRILQRVKALNGKKQLFQAWKGSASFITGSRKKRLASRFMTRWRQNYREAVANQLVRETSRKLTRLTFISWRIHSKRQCDSHSRSIEFIGNSSLHYYLQRWRTETTAKRCNQNLAKGGKIGWVQMLKNSPRYQNYSRIPGRRSTLTLSREDPLLEMTPLVDTEFMV